jgi:hypothetical protein
MSDDKLDALFDESKPVVAQEPVVEPAEPAAISTPAEGVMATPPVADRKSDAIPIQALLDERDKRQKTEREMETLRAELAKLQPQTPPPDLYADPEARMQFERQGFERAIINNKLEQSRFWAEDKYGKELVDAAYAYFDQHPELSQQLLSKPSPFHAAVEFYQRQKAAEEVGTDPVAYRARLASEIEADIRAKVMAELSSAPQPKLPGSLASAPAAGKSNETIPRGGFESAFGG